MLCNLSEVVISKLKNISNSIKSDNTEVITREVKKMLDRYSELVIKENASVAKGDVAIIDFEGFKDGVAFEGGKGENYELEKKRMRKR